MSQSAFKTVGLLHPGMMGSSVGAALKTSQARVIWASEGRSDLTKERAAKDELEDLMSLANLVEESDLIVSVCPPDRALELAAQVKALAYSGVYLDANAVSPDTMSKMQALFESTAIELLDGSIVGPPARQKDSTRLYLSGENATNVASLFEDSKLEPVVMGDRLGQASALKMAYAAWTKGTSALLMAIQAFAKHEGVTETLENEWATSIPDLVARSETVLSRTPLKAWRFEGEMKEIASSFAHAGVTDKFHLAAADIYKDLASFKDAETINAEDVLTQLLDKT